MTFEIDDAFRTGLYRDYHGKVLGYVRSHIGNPSDAEDLAEEVFRKVYQHLDTYDQTRSSISTWIYTITRNQVVDYYRRRRESLPLDEAIIDSTPDKPAATSELVEDLAEALAELPSRQRDAVILFYYNGYDHKEIARHMGVSYDSARKLCSLGVMALRKKLIK